MKQHKHSDIIHYYADGGNVDYQSCDGKWIEMQKPGFLDHVNYRKRPEKKQFRVARMRNILGAEYPWIERSWGAGTIYGAEGFVEWITEWTDFE